MPLTNLNLSQANSVSLNTLSSNNLYFDGVDYYTATSINGAEYLNKLILKQNVPFYNFVYSTGSTLSISNVNTLNYLVVNTNVDTFSANFGSFTLGLSNIYVSNDFNSCQLRVNLGPGLSCNKTNIFVTTDAVLSSNTNQFYTFSYYNTGSLILGFSLSGVPQPLVTPPIPSFPTPTPTRTSTITQTPTVTPTITITPTISITPTRTATPTVTPTISITLTISITPTITVTPTVTQTRTPTPSPAPSGIPVASTANVLVDGFSLSKQSSTLYIGEVVTDVEDCGGNPDYADISFRGELEFTGGSWRYLYGRWGGCVGGWWGGTWQTTYTNASTNANLIPTTGWSPSITITAA